MSARSPFCSSLDISPPITHDLSVAPSLSSVANSAHTPSFSSMPTISPTLSSSPPSVVSMEMSIPVCPLSLLDLSLLDQGQELKREVNSVFRSRQELARRNGSSRILGVRDRPSHPSSRERINHQLITVSISFSISFFFAFIQEEGGVEARRTRSSIFLGLSVFPFSKCSWEAFPRASNENSLIKEKRTVRTAIDTKCLPMLLCFDCQISKRKRKMKDER